MSTPNLHFRLLYRILRTDAAARNNHVLYSAFLSMLAYQTPEYIQRIASHLHVVNWKFYSKKSFQAYMLEFEDRVVVAFRGTQPKVLDDIFACLRFGKQFHSKTKAHEGFVSALRPVAEEIALDLARSEKPLHLIGHSMGGALALLFSLVKKPDKIYTFGCPRVFERSESIEKMFDGVEIAQFFTKYDIVRFLPFRWMGYTHVSKGQVIKDKLRLNIFNSHRMSAYIESILDDE